MDSLEYTETLSSMESPRPIKSVPEALGNMESPQPIKSESPQPIAELEAVKAELETDVEMSMGDFLECEEIFRHMDEGPDSIKIEPQEQDVNCNMIPEPLCVVQLPAQDHSFGISNCSGMTCMETTEDHLFLQTYNSDMTDLKVVSAQQTKTL